jgi:hypothetical protein
LPRMLGRRAPKHAPALHLANYLTGVVPDHPASADHFAKVTQWGLWGNDQYGTCGPVSFYNLRKLVTAYATGVEAQPTQDDVFALYKLCNPDFDPRTGRGDNGVDMQTMLELALKHEVLGPGVMLGFAKVDPANLNAVRAATSIFGGLLHGVDLEIAQQSQTDTGGPWDYRRSAEWGGHAVLSGRYRVVAGAAKQDRQGVVTWAEVIDCTDAFETHQLEEVWAVIFREHLDHPAFQQGVDVPALAADFEQLTGRPFPAAPTPPAPPGPPIGDVDVALADAYEAFQAAFETWRAAKGL